MRSLGAETGRTVAVHHWGHVEVSKTGKFEAVAVALDGITTDLLAWSTATFHVRGMARIKDIAPLFGFAWAVDDPGGRLAMAMIDVARTAAEGADDARRWRLLCNESDVAAQAAIRDGLRRMSATQSCWRRAQITPAPPRSTHCCGGPRRSRRPVPRRPIRRMPARCTSAG